MQMSKREQLRPSICSSNKWRGHKYKILCDYCTRKTKRTPEQMFNLQ
jgi:hypothetical protein